MQRSYRLALNSLAALSPFLTPGAASAEPGPALGARAGQTLFFEDFELGWNGWYTDNGVWQVGDPTAGPPGPFSGTKCAATELHGNYDANADSRLIGPSIVLDPVVGDEELHLRFQEWFSYEHCDAGYVQISTFDAGTQVWGAWTTVGEFVEHTSPWSLRDVDLTPFAGEQVRLGFYHTAAYGGGCGGSSTGWYIDDVAIMKCSPVLGGSFESGWEGWGADRGVWQVGSPTTGPAAAFEGTNVAGTVLDSNYGANTDSRLVSPTVRLDPVAVGEELHLRFREWFSYDHCDAGYVQISTYDTGTGTWADWVTLSPYVEHTSPWSLKDVDLTAYAGQVARVAFYHTAGYGGGCGGSSTGWYLDEIEIVRNVPVFTGDFESGWAGWGADRGVWDVGSPTTGPAAAFEGLNVAGTALDGNYGANTDSRLISPTVRLDTVVAGEELHLRFREWFSYDHCDAGYVQISTYDTGTGTWADWVTLSPYVEHTSPWSLKDVDLTAYAGQVARVAFYHTAGYGGGCGGSSTGWYLDEIEIVRNVPVFTGDFESGWAGWGADRGVWDVGSPTTGPAAAFEGLNVAGTALDGNYGANTDSRLISPTVRLDGVPPNGEVHVRFWEWTSFGHCDGGSVQVSAYDPGTGAWVDWVTVGSASASVPSWSLRQVDLTAYAGQQVRLAFYHTAAYGGGCGGSSHGWFIDEVRVQHRVGTTYCSPAVDNSTGAPAEIRAIGSDVVDQNQLDVFATGMPNSQFGYFLASETQGLIPHPGGSPGTLCVVGTIARFNAPIENSGADGSFSIAVDLTQIPTSPAHAVTGGETWHFQAWYRDGGSSNFTDAVSVLFR